MQGGYDDTVIDQEIAKVGGCLIIDAKGVFDAIHRSESAHNPDDSSVFL